MKKTIKSRRVEEVAKNNHTGVALLLCFVIAGVAVAITLRQLALERRLITNTTEDGSIVKVAGEYRVAISAGKLVSRVITLSLSSDRSVKLTVKTQGNDEVQELTGTWSGDSNGTIITSFKDKVYAFSYQPEGAGTLRLLNPDVELWGAATLTLTRN